MTASGSIAIAQDFAHRGTLVGLFNAVPSLTVAAVPDSGGIGNNVATARLLFDSSGGTDYAYFMGANVGINIAAPVQPLHVYHATTNFVGRFESGDAGAGIVFEDTVDATYVYTESGKFVASPESTLAGYVDGIVLDQATGNVSAGTVTPDRRIHSEVLDAVTAAITYATRRSHTTSGAAAALFGVGHEDELEDAAGNMQVASEAVTLWATATSAAESPLYRVTTYPAGAVGPGYSGHWTWAAVNATARTMIPNGTGDVSACITLMWAAYAITGADYTGGTVTLGPSESWNLYDDGTDVLTLAVAADGSVTIQRTAGADTWNFTAWGTWL